LRDVTWQHPLLLGLLLFLRLVCMIEGFTTGSRACLPTCAHPCRCLARVQIPASARDTNSPTASKTPTSQHSFQQAKAQVGPGRGCRRRFRGFWAVREQGGCGKWLGD
jgi:hypothetical protein